MMTFTCNHQVKKRMLGFFPPLEIIVKVLCRYTLFIHVKVVLALPELALCNLVGVPLLGVDTGRDNQDKTEK